MDPLQQIRQDLIKLQLTTENKLSDEISEFPSLILLTNNKSLLDLYISSNLTMVDIIKLLVKKLLVEHKVLCGPIREAGDEQKRLKLEGEIEVLKRTSISMYDEEKFHSQRFIINTTKRMIDHITNAINEL